MAGSKRPHERSLAGVIIRMIQAADEDPPARQGKDGEADPAPPRARNEHARLKPGHNGEDEKAQAGRRSRPAVDGGQPGERDQPEDDPARTRRVAKGA